MEHLAPRTSELPEALLRRDRTGNAFEQTVGRLAEAIKLGAFAPGEKLPSERDLAVLMQVSRMTLREALNSLREAGFVETRRGRTGGTYVRADAGALPQPSSLRQIREGGRRLDDALDYRRIVEAGAAELAASRDLEDADRTRLSNALAEVEGSLDDGRRRAADARLHLVIAQLGGSESVVAAVADAQIRLGDLLAAIPVLRPNIEHSDEQHRAVVGCICSGDPAGARAAMAEHCDGTAALLRGLLG